MVALLTNYVSTNANCLRLLRELFWVLVNNDIQLDVRHISIVDNLLADTLSRVYYPDKWNAKCAVLKESQLCCNEKFFVFSSQVWKISRTRCIV